MKKQVIVVFVALLFVSNAFSQSQMTPDSLIQQAMHKVSFIVGKWSGDGWIMLGKEKHFFHQHEEVTIKVNETVLVIDGLGTDSKTGKVIHQAFAVVTFDLANSKYLMRAFKANGGYIDADAMVLDDGSFVWGFALPQAGQIRYTLKLVDGKWNEKGEMSRDGNNWFLFFEMNLSKE